MEILYMPLQNNRGLVEHEHCSYSNFLLNAPNCHGSDEHTGYLSCIVGYM